MHKIVTKISRNMKFSLNFPINFQYKNFSLTTFSFSSIESWDIPTETRQMSVQKLSFYLARVLLEKFRNWKNVRFGKKIFINFSVTNLTSFVSKTFFFCLYAVTSLCHFTSKIERAFSIAHWVAFVHKVQNRIWKLFFAKALNCKFYSWAKNWLRKSLSRWSQGIRRATEKFYKPFLEFISYIWKREWEIEEKAFVKNVLFSFCTPRKLFFVVDDFRKVFWFSRTTFVG